MPEEVGNANTFPDGIDVRGVGGYVVGPGCEVGGRTYAHESGDLDQIADCPEWVRGFLGRSSRKDVKRTAPLCDLDLKHNIEEAEKFLARRDPAITGNNGNDWTFETVAFIRDIGLSESMVLEVILESNWNSRCEPPWAADELAGLIENVYRYAKNRPGCRRAPLSVVRLMADVVPLHPEQYSGWYEKQRQEDVITAVTEAAVETTPADSSERRRRFKLRSEAEQDNQPDIDWLIPGVIQRETLALFYGQENSFKSFLVLDMMLSASAAVAWASYGGREMSGGYAADRPLTVIYYAGEGARGHCQTNANQVAIAFLACS